MKKMMLAMAIASSVLGAQAVDSYVASSADPYKGDTVNISRYSSYYFSATAPYADLVSYFSNLCLWDIQKELVNHTANPKTTYYFEEQGSITTTADKYTTGNDISTVINNQETAYAMFIYFNGDYSESGQDLAFDIVGCNSTTMTWANYDFNKDAAALLGKNDGWHKINSIPEPTSGLLRLLGIAGLALKRKRA